MSREYVSNVQDPYATEFRLIQQLKSSRAEGWVRFTELYTPLVDEWARQAGLSPDDAACISYEVFRHVASRLDSIVSGDLGSGIRDWLWSITRNTLLQFFHRRNRRAFKTNGDKQTKHPQELPKIMQSATPPTTPIANMRLLKQAVNMIQSEFHRTTWHAFWRSAMVREPDAQISADLGISVTDVQQAKRRVLFRLSEVLAEL